MTLKAQEMISGDVAVMRCIKKEEEEKKNCLRFSKPCQLVKLDSHLFRLQCKSAADRQTGSQAGSRLVHTLDVDSLNVWQNAAVFWLTVTAYLVSGFA